MKKPGGRSAQTKGQERRSLPERKGQKKSTEKAEEALVVDPKLVAEALRRTYQVNRKERRGREVVGETVLRMIGYEPRETVRSGKFFTVKRALYQDSEYSIKIYEKSCLPMKFIEDTISNKFKMYDELIHVNITRYTAAIETTFRIYIISDYCVNGTLKDLIMRSTHVEEKLSRRLFGDLLSAVDFCQSMYIAHRYINSENLKFDYYYTMKLCNFDFATKVDYTDFQSSSMYPPACVNFHYAAPEIIYGRKYNLFSADVWSAGVVFFEMVTGTLPFHVSADGMDCYTERMDTFEFPFCTFETMGTIKKILRPEEERITLHGLFSILWLKEEMRESAWRNK